MPRYWVPEFDVPTEKRDKKNKIIYEMGAASRLRKRDWPNGWLMRWRDIARSTDQRTMIGAALPAQA